MLDIVTGLSCFFNGHAEVLVPFLLKGKKMILLLKSGISVQDDRHHEKHGMHPIAQRPSEKSFS